MDYETKLKDERLIGIKEGRIEEKNRNARNIIIAFKDDLTDEEIQQMIDDVDERN